MIKLVDQLSAMGSFPIATAQDIVCSDNIRLQEKIDNGTLGGGGGSTATTLTQEEYDALDSQEQLKGEFYCYDSARHFRNGVEYGKAVDISGKQDDLHKVKFTMRRNSVNEPRYCLIGSSDLTKTLLMNEPYRFDGTFGSNNNIEKSITSFTVSFKEGVGDPSRILRGFTNNAEGFKYVDLLITVDETENLAYAYVDFLQENSLASGEITKPFLDAESYMDFAESFELVDTYKGTLVCKMSDYCKVITEIDDTTTSTDTVWSSKKTSDEIADIESALKDKADKTELDGSKKLYITNTGANIKFVKITSAPLNGSSIDIHFKSARTNTTFEEETVRVSAYISKTIYDGKIIQKGLYAANGNKPNENEANFLVILDDYSVWAHIASYSTAEIELYSYGRKQSIDGTEATTLPSEVKYSMFNGAELATMDKVNANLGELCNKKIYCGEVTGTIVDGVISTSNPIGKVGNAIATMQYANGNPRGYSITTQVTLSALNFYFRWHRESDGAEAYPPDGTKITISYMIFY